MRVLAVQHDIAWQDKPSNHAAAERAVDEATPPARALVVLPELFDSGFSMDLDAFVDVPTEPWAQEFARRRELHLLCGHAARGPEGRGRNCATLVSADGLLRGRYEKVHPFSIGQEATRYDAGRRLMLREVEGAVVCPLICYDLRFPELWRLAARAGAEVFLIGANWPAARQSHWRALCIARAIENQAFVVGVNRVGSDPRIRYAGGSLVVGPRGDVLAEAGDGAQAISAELDLDRLRAWRRDFPALRDMHPELLGAIEVDRDTASPAAARGAPQGAAGADATSARAGT